MKPLTHEQLLAGLVYTLLEREGMDKAALLLRSGAASAEIRCSRADGSAASTLHQAAERLADAYRY